MTRHKLVVLIGGPSPEHDVSILTGLQARVALGGETNLIYWDKRGSFYLIEDKNVEAKDFVEAPKKQWDELNLVLAPEGGWYFKKSKLGKKSKLDVDVIINCCHGGPGEDGTLQAALELIGIAFTGPDSMSAYVCMDKLRFYELIKFHNFPCLDRASLDGDSTRLNSPFIVKPRFGGSSFGIEVVSDLETARQLGALSAHFAQGGVIEEFRSDLFDIQVGLRVFPTLEISEIERPLKRDSSSILEFKDKYVSLEGMVSAKRELPAKINAKLKDQVANVSKELANLLKLKGIWRIDYLTNGENELYVNEINTIPGSLARYLFINPKRDFKELLEDMVEEALTRRQIKYSSLGADSNLLQSALTIAEKLR